MGWRVQPIFTIELHKKDISLLEDIKTALCNVGSIYSPRKNTIQYRITSVKELQVVINHFDKYPLISNKYPNYELWKFAVNLIESKQHLTPEGLEKIVSIRAAMNLGLTDELKIAFTNITPYPKLDSWSRDIKDPNWLAGFSSGDGSFIVTIFKSKTTRLRESVLLNFNISQHSSDKLLIKSFVEFLGCGKVYLYPNLASFNVFSFNELYTKLIPFFDKYPIKGVKFKDYLDFVKVAELVKSKAHLKKSGLDQIRDIKMNMNRNRDIK